MRMRAALWVLILLGFLAPQAVHAQSFETVGTRPAGMAGAFVAVADDATAVYWNPAGLATGSYFSLVLDQGSAEAKDADALQGGSRSGGIIAAGVPMLGLSYYRLRASRVDPVVGIPGFASGARLESLITHHVGATLVQSLTDRIAVGATLKLVRGVAATAIAPQSDVDELLDEADDLVGSAQNRFDADLGVIASAGNVRAGLTVRNVREPEFDLPLDTGRSRLDRQVRAGVAFTGVQGLLVAADLDLEKVRGTMGEERNLAVGAEARVLRRVFVRSGFRLNTATGDGARRRPVASAGGSYAAIGSFLVDAQVTLGAETSDRGWGVGARVVF